MNYEKYITYLEDKYNKAFSLSKEIAVKRDTKLIEAFIDKTMEEISFNDFYISGNEDVLKYAGVVLGLKEKQHPYFKQTSAETKKRLQEIKMLSEEMIADNEDQKSLFENFKEGAEYCLNDFIDESLTYQSLNQKAKLQRLLITAKEITENNNLSIASIMKFKQIVEEGEKHLEKINQINASLENKSYVKKNAFRAVKNFNWLHEKGTFDHMTKTQKQVYLSRQQVKECRAKAELVFGILTSNSNKDEKVRNGIA